MATPNIVPRADSEGGIGTASKYWGSAYIDVVYVSAGSIGRDADNNINFAVDNNIAFKANGQNRLHVNSGTLYPEVNNALSLGYATREFSDLFLGDGAVINFNNGNVTLTHSSNALTLADGDVLALGTSSDLQLFHESNNSIIQNYVGDLTIRNFSDDGDIIFMSDDGSGGTTAYLTIDGSETLTQVHKHFKFDDNAQVQLGTGSDLRLYHTGSTSFVMNYVGDVRFINYQDDGDFKFETDDGSGGTTEYLRIDGSAVETQFSKDVRIIDNEKLILGTGNDLEVFSLGQDILFRFWSGNATFINYSNDADIIFQNDDGAGGTATYFYLDGSSATHDGSATTGLYTNWPDNSRITLGTSHDLDIHHGGTNSFIQNQTGDLYIINRADDKDIIFQSDDGSGGTTTFFFLDGSHGGGPVTMFPDNSTINLGSTLGDLKISHGGGNSIINNGTGALSIRQSADGNDIHFQCDDGSGGTTNYLTLDGGLGYTTVQKHLQAADSVEYRVGTGGDARFMHDGSNTYLDNFTGDLYIRNNADNRDIIFQSDDGSGGVETYFFLDGSASSGPFTAFPDSSKLTFGGGRDLQISHDGSNSYIHHSNTGDLEIKADVGDIKIVNYTNDKDIIFSSDDSSGGVTAYITLDGSAARTVFSRETQHSDNVKGKFGNSGDLQIYHDGSNSFIDNNAGIFRITQNLADGDLVLRADNGAGSSTPYLTLDGSATTTVFSKDTRHNDNIKALFGGNNDFKIYHDGTNSYINNATGTLFINNQTNDSDIVFRCDDGAGGAATYFQLDGSSATHDGSATTNLFTNWPDKSTISLGTSHDLQLFHNAIDSYILNSTGNLYIGNNANDKDIIFQCDDGSGGTTEYFRLDGGLSNSGYVYTSFPDNSVLAFGAAPDLQIYHDGSNSYIKDSGTGSLKVMANNLYLQNATGENYINCYSDDRVEIFHNNSKKLETTSTGISVTGGLTTTSTVILSNLPTSDPGTTGQLWNDNGTLKISAGG